MKTDLVNAYLYGMKSEGISVSLKAGGNGVNSFFRDFCSETCLRDYLNKNLPATAMHIKWHHLTA
jgi:hypothetical protein